MLKMAISISSIKALPLGQRLAISISSFAVMFGGLFAVLDYSANGQITMFKSDAWHVGQCAGGKLTTADGTRAPEFLVESALRSVAIEHGLSLSELKQGYNSYIPGKMYHNSCKVASGYENR